LRLFFNDSHLGRAGRSFSFIDKLNGQAVAQVSRQPKKMYSISVEAGYDVLQVLMATVIADRV